MHGRGNHMQGQNTIDGSLQARSHAAHFKRISDKHTYIVQFIARRIRVFSGSLELARLIARDVSASAADQRDSHLSTRN